MTTAEQHEMRQMLQTRLVRFPSQSELEIKLATTIAMAETQLTGGDLGAAFEVAILSARAMSKYVPHVYCGGYVIPGFGYSTERIGKYVTEEEAGNPSRVI